MIASYLPIVFNAFDTTKNTYFYLVNQSHLAVLPGIEE